MLVSMQLDPDEGVVVATYSGTLTGADILEFRGKLVAHAGFRADLDHLSDLTDVEHVDIGTDELAQLAMATPFGEEGRVALVAARDVVYGLSRVWEFRVGPGTAEVEVFRDLAEARKWLGLAEDQ